MLRVMTVTAAGLSLLCLWQELRIFKLIGDLADTKSGLRQVIEQADAERNKFQESEKERKWLKNKVLQK